MAEQPKEYYEKKPGYTIKSGTSDGAGRTMDYSMMTDTNQGFEYTKDGMKFDLCNKTSYELCGEDVQDGEPAKIIRAFNGNIIIEALDGDVIIKGKNIRFVASDAKGEITMNANAQIAQTSPKVAIKATNIDGVATSTHAVAGNFVDTAAGVSNNSSTATDETQGRL